MLPSPPQAGDFSSRPFAVADCLVLPQLNRIVRAGESIQLEPKVMEVLVCLASRGQDVVGKQELLDEVWADSFVSDHVLTHVVWQLRKALGSAALVETVRRRGYRLTVDAVLEEKSNPPERVSTDTVLEGESALAGAPSARARRTKGRWLGVAVAGLASLVAGGVYWTAQRQPATAQQPVSRLLMAPLDSTGNGDSQRLLVDALDAGLREQFLEVHALQILTGRSAAWRYSGASRKPLADLAREARADAIAEGTATVIEGRVRVTMQVWDTRSNRVLLAETFERGLQDVLQLYGDVVRRVARAGNVPIADAEAPRLGGPSLQADTSREYLMGLGLARAGRDWKEAVQHYRRAIELNPEFAPAYASAALLLRFAVTEGLPLAELAPCALEARAMAQRAVQLDPQSVRAAVALGLVEGTLFWNWQEARSRFEHAARLRPDHPLVARDHVEFLTYTRQCDKALEFVEHEKDTDPLSAYPINREHWVHYMCGDYEAAINDGQAALARDASARFVHYHMAYAYAATGRHPQAIAECRKSDPTGECREPFVLAKAGRTREARALLDAWERQGDGPSPFFVALGLTGLGERERALAWLAKGREQHDPNMRLIWDPALAALHDDPRFRELTCQLDLPPGACASDPAVPFSR